MENFKELFEDRSDATDNINEATKNEILELLREVHKNNIKVFNKEVKGIRDEVKGSPNEVMGRLNSLERIISDWKDELSKVK